MKIINKSFGVMFVFGVLVMFVQEKAMAAAWSPTAPLTVSTSLGSLGGLDSVLKFVANLLKYVGWAGVIIAILAVIGLLIFKLIGEDSENTMKVVQGGITKAVIIALLGLLLLSAGFFINFTNNIVGGSTSTYTIDGGLGSGGSSQPTPPADDDNPDPGDSGTQPGVNPPEN